MPPPTSLQPSSEKRFNWKSVLIQGAKWILAGILLFTGGKQIVEGCQQLQDRRIVFVPLALIVSAALYAGGMACFAGYWRQSVLAMGGRLSPLDSQRTYFASQLGKYVPGKAWVLLIRCGLTDRRSTSATVVVASTFYETLVMMAAGALIASLCLLMAGITERSLLRLAFGLAVGLVVAVQPWVFRKLLAVGMLPFQRWGSDLVKPVSHSTLFRGIIYFVPGWALSGLSLIAAARGIGVSLTGAREIWLACGSMALAVVGGFAILVVPAGLGVREWVLMRTLGPTIGTGNAALIAIVVRIMTVIAELLVAGCLYFLVKRNPENA